MTATIFLIKRSLNLIGRRILSIDKEIKKYIYVPLIKFKVYIFKGENILKYCTEEILKINKEAYYLFPIKDNKIYFINIIFLLWFYCYHVNNIKNILVMKQ